MSISNTPFFGFIPFLNVYVCNFSNSQKKEDAASKRRRFCRSGAGVEQHEGRNDTPGFEEIHEPRAVYDLRKFWKLDLPRNNKRVLQTSMFLVASNRANGDMGVMLYNKNPLQPSSEELRNVVGYVVDYASKSNETEQQARENMKTLILSEQSTTGGKWDMSRVSVRAMNQLIQHRLTSIIFELVQLGG